MKTLMILTVGLAMAGASVAQAQPYDPGRGPAAMGDRGDMHRDGGRHGHRVCFWRHHQRICRWR